MGAKVLLAHGDIHQLEVAVQALTAEGFEVVATPDGGDAFARFFEEDPDVVVASVVLPVLDGRGFATMIKSQTPDVPVVLLTDDLPDTPDPSGILYLPEPLDVDALRELVPALGQRQATGEIELRVSEENRELFETLVSFQRQGNILSLLDTPGLERLAAIAAIRDCPAGDLVIREGDPCDGFYLVVIGAVRVTLAERGDDEVARLGPGEFFGEMALLSDQPRSASVWTCDPTKLLFFEREAVLQLLHDYPGMRELLGGVALQRAEDNLWQALSGDDDVQRNLSVLLDGLEEEDGVDSVEISAGDAQPLGVPPPAAAATEVPPTPTALEPGTGIPAGAGGPLSAPVPPAEAAMREADEKLAELTIDEDVTLGSPGRGRGLSWSVKDILYSLRLYSLRHQFGVGLALGAVVGIVAMVAVLAVVFGDSPGQDVPLVPDGQLGADTRDADQGDDAIGDDAAGDDAAADDAAADDAAADDAAADDAAADDVDDEPDAGDDVEADDAEAGDAADDGDEAGGGADPAPPDRPALAKLGKKSLRKALLAAHEAGRFADAYACGLELERRFKLDWEAEFKTADAARQAGYGNKAVELYATFAEKYPTNVYADDALFWSAKVLAGQGKLAAARALFEKVAANPESDLRRKAAQRADELSE